MGLLSPVRPIAVAFGTVAVALTVNSLLWPWIQPSRYPFFLAAVAFSAWKGGRVSGLFAIFFGALSTSFFFLEPYYSFGLSLGGYFSLLTFLAVSTLLLHIVDRLNAAESLSEARARDLEAVIESLDEPLSVLDHEWRICHVNTACARYLGLPRTDLLGQVVWELFPGTQGTLFEDYYRRAVREHEPVRFEAFHRATDRWLMVKAVPYTEGLIVNFREMTTRNPIQNSLANCAQGSFRFRMTEPISVKLEENALIDAFYRSCVLENLDPALASVFEVAERVDSGYEGIPIDAMFPRSNGSNVESLRAFIRSGFRLDNAILGRQSTQGTKNIFTFQLVGRIEQGRLTGLTGLLRRIGPGGATT